MEISSLLSGFSTNFRWGFCSKCHIDTVLTSKLKNIYFENGKTTLIICLEKVTKQLQAKEYSHSPVRNHHRASGKLPKTTAHTKISPQFTSYTTCHVVYVISTEVKLTL